MKKLLTIIFIICIILNLFSINFELIEIGKVYLQNFTYKDFKALKFYSDKQDYFIIDKKSNIWLQSGSLTLIKFNKEGFLDKIISLYNGSNDDGIWAVNLFNDYITADIQGKKIAILDKKGNILKYIHLPLFTKSSSLCSFYFDNNFIFSNGYFSNENEKNKVFLTAMINIKNGNIIKLSNEVMIKKFVEDSYVPNYRYYPLKLPNGNYIIYNRYFYKIVEYNKKGNVIYVYNKEPLNFKDYKGLKSCRDVSNKEIIEIIQNKKNNISSDYPFNFSLGGKPILYKDYFIIPRRIFPPYYLDIYNFQTKKYEGQVELQDRLIINSHDERLYCLNDGAEDDRVNFSIYKLITKNDYKKYLKNSSKVFKESIDILNQKIKNGISSCGCHKKYVFKKNPNFVNNINHVIIKAPQQENLFINLFSKKKKYISDYIKKNGKFHIIFTWRDNRKNFINCYKTVTNYLKKYGNVFDGYLILSSNKFDILKNVKNTFKFQKDMNIILNLAPKNIDAIYYEKANYDMSTIIIVDDNGSIKDYFSFSNDKDYKNLFERFLNKMTK